MVRWEVVEGIRHTIFQEIALIKLSQRNCKKIMRTSNKMAVICLDFKQVLPECEGQRAVSGLMGALLAVGMVLAKPEKSTYSCQVQCMHNLVLVMVPRQRV